MKPRPAVLQFSRNWQRLIDEFLTPPSGFGGRRYFHPTMAKGGKIQPAKRVAGKRQDVWYVVDPLLLHFGVYPFSNTSLLLRPLKVLAVVG